MWLLSLCRLMISSEVKWNFNHEYMGIWVNLAEKWCLVDDYRRWILPPFIKDYSNPIYYPAYKATDDLLVDDTPLHILGILSQSKNSGSRKKPMEWDKTSFSFHQSVAMIRFCHWGSPIQTGARCVSPNGEITEIIMYGDIYRDRHTYECISLQQGFSWWRFQHVVYLVVHFWNVICANTHRCMKTKKKRF